MKANHKVICLVLITVVLNTILFSSAFAGSSAVKSNEQTSKNYEMLEGVLSIKEGHGEFLILLPDGKAQRFSVKIGAAEITRNGKPVRYNELKVNDSIQVQYDGSTREVIAIHAKEAAEKTSQSQSDNYETIEGVLSIKEGHGDFLVRLSDGSAQRFRVRGDAAEIIRNGEPVRYSALKVSDSIQVKYAPSNRKVIAIQASGS